MGHLDEGYSKSDVFCPRKPRDRWQELPMEETAANNVTLMLRLRQHYGDLNTALVGEYLRAYGPASVSFLSQHLVVNRSVVRRALQKLSENDAP